MATMLAFITTDCHISPEMLQEALCESAACTYNRICVDGDTSTNDMTAMLASGAAGNTQITEKNADYSIFLDALYSSPLPTLSPEDKAGTDVAA
jgi:glutamate N-acetyltransferase/amino-acid N-acetyltransferase